MDKMNAIKEVIGGSKQDEAGQEPVSGKQGQGTAGQPYDAGNQEEDANLAGKAPQHTKPNETPVLNKSGQEPVSGEQGKGTAAQPFDAGNQEDKSGLAGKAPADGKSSDRPAEPATNGTAGDAKSSPKLSKPPAIGSSRWFANPFAKDKDKESSSDKAAQAVMDPKATSTAADGQANSGAEAKSFALSHLGEDVPPGQNTIVVDPPESRTIVIDSVLDNTHGNSPSHLGEDVPSGPTQNGEKIDKGKGKAKATAADLQSNSEPSPGYTESSTASNRSTRRESGSTDLTAATRNTFSSFATSVAGSVAGSSRNASGGNLHIVHSQGKPIMAGGVPLGLPAMQERERRFSSAVPSHYREDDELTKTNTEANTNAVLTSVPPPKRPEPEPTKMRASVSRDSAVAIYGDDDGKPRRRSSVIMRAKTLGRKVRHSIAH